MRERTDVLIIGGGISGLMAALRICENSPGVSVLIVEKGRAIERRHCPIVEKKSGVCARCASCAIMNGMAGAGAFSDGKYVISTEYGGWLTDYMPRDTALDYIEQADRVLMRFGAPAERFMPSGELKLLCLKHDLHMQQAQLKHLGTDANFETMRRMIEHVGSRCEVVTGAHVTDVDKATRVASVMLDGAEHKVAADKVIFAVGRGGSLEFSQWCRKNGIPQSSNQVDVGVRVELSADIWTHFSSVVYEPKIWYRSRMYGDVTRMFCFNERGSVVLENTDGIMTVNGHAYKDEARKTENSNFALLCTMKFTQPFNEPITYARSVANLANVLTCGGVLVQRLGDLTQGRRTNGHRLRQSTTRPTLEAVPGDLSLCLPKRQLDNIVETLHKLDCVAPGTANHDTLLYGVECKYYSARPECDDFALAGCEGIYAVGDGSGFTRSLSHAAANGLYVADKITGRR